MKHWVGDGCTGENEARMFLSRKSDSKACELWIPEGSENFRPRTQQLVCMNEALKALISTFLWCHFAQLGGMVPLN